MKVIDILPERIYLFNAPKGIVKTCLKVAEAVEYSRISDYKVSEDVFLHRLPEMKEVKRWWESCLDEVIDQFQIPVERMDVVMAWTNRSLNDMWRGPHVHPNSFASGIFYLSESPAETWFSRAPMWATGTSYGDIYPDLPEKHDIFKYKTSPGHLLIFPSKLMHSVSEHKGDQPRYSMAFNSMPAGLVGYPESLAGYKATYY